MFLMEPANNTILKRIAGDLFQKTHLILSQDVAERYVYENTPYSLKKYIHLSNHYKEQNFDVLRSIIYRHFDELKGFFLKE